MEAATNFDDIRQILQEHAQSQKETDRINQRNAKLIGDLGNRFGSFTDGVAFVDASEQVIQEAEKTGLYVARIHDELFEILPLHGVLPKDFSQVDTKQ